MEEPPAIAVEDEEDEGEYAKGEWVEALFDFDSSVRLGPLCLLGY